MQKAECQCSISVDFLLSCAIPRHVNTTFLKGVFKLCLVHCLKPSNICVCLTQGKSINLKHKKEMAASVCGRWCWGGGIKQNMQLNVANCGIIFGEVAWSSVCGVPDSEEGDNRLGTWTPPNFLVFSTVKCKNTANNKPCAGVLGYSLSLYLVLGEPFSSKSQSSANMVICTQYSSFSCLPRRLVGWECG